VPDHPHPRHGLRCRRKRRQAGRFGLQQRPHVEKLVDLAVGRHVHEGPLGRAQVDPAFGLQPVQRLTHRLPADTELAGQVGFHQVLTRLEIAPDDELDQGLVDGMTQRHGPLNRTDPLAG
jgi:hypothetical protein